jgi:hypothetical protein
MADKKADSSGVQAKEVRRAISRSPIWVVAQVWLEERQKVRKMDRAKAAKLLGITPKPKPAPKPKAAPKAAVPVADPAVSSKRKRLVRALILALLFLMLLASLLTWVWFLNRPRIEATSLPPVGSPTPTAITAPAAVDPTSVGEPAPSAEVVYLRVETLQLDTAYGVWRRMPGVPIFLSPYQEGDSAPDFGRDGTIRQVTEEKVTADARLVAATTFSAPPGTYWAGVDESELPAGCSVWIALFEDDPAEMRPATWSPPLVMEQPGVMYTWKFQIICGQEVSVSPTVVNTQPPGPTSTPVSPTDPPPTNPPPTDPPPTPEPTTVDCNCETPVSPLPTIAAPTEWSPTPISTPFR